MTPPRTFGLRPPFSLPTLPGVTFGRIETSSSSTPVVVDARRADHEVPAVEDAVIHRISARLSNEILSAHLVRLCVEGFAVAHCRRASFDRT